jgi:osmotically-inducible protein OsmY
MEDWSREVVERKLRNYLPETQEEAEQLAALIEKAIEHETGNGIRELAIVIEGDGILLSGRCESFYHKQLAQHAAMSISGCERLVNGIEVFD